MWSHRSEYVDIDSARSPELRHYRLLGKRAESELHRNARMPVTHNLCQVGYGIKLIPEP